MPKITVQPLSIEQRAEITEWLQSNGDSVPEYVRIALEQHEQICEALGSSRYKQSQILAELKRALGITASSEKRTSNSNDPIGALSQGDGQRPKDKREQLRLLKERLERLSRWHRRLARRQAAKAKAIDSKMMDDEGFEFTAEEEAELAEEDRQFNERLNLGEGEEPAYQSVTETLMNGANAKIEEHHERVPADISSFGQARILKTMVEERERYDFSFMVTRIILEVEKTVIEDTQGKRRIISGSTEEWGPRGYAVTWEFLAHMAVLVAQYAIPMNRLAKMLSTDEQRFTSSAFSRFLQYVARRFLPVYLYLVDSLSDCDVLMGDDTSTRVLEVRRFFKEPRPAQQAPWFSYRTCEQAAQTVKQEQRPTLGALLAQELGFEFDRRSSAGKKTSLKTTTIAGRSIATEPRSFVVIYRSHLGGLGNLLEMLLEKRLPEKRELTIQSDLSTVNLVSNPELCACFNIRYAGCASHARRPFALYEHEDPENCARMLHLFKGVFIYERCLAAYGRNRENVMAVRSVDSRSLWTAIKELSEEMSTKWSPKTKLGEAARYIVRNFDKLTTYLDDPRLELTNNLSERMLRPEKQIEESALFRIGLEGRFTLDIIRSVIQTAIAAQVSVQEYLVHVLQAQEKDIKESPERFTPFVYATSRAEDPQNDNSLNTS